MGLGFVVVVTAIGLFVLAPLVLAWVSGNPARWERVEESVEPEVEDRAEPGGPAAGG